MKIKLKVAKSFEIEGKLKTVRPGQIADVGKHIALKWIREGAAESLQIDLDTASYAIGTPYTSQLIKEVQAFWYNNVETSLVIESQRITREMIHVYGGPSPEYNGCPICQWTEWLSRVLQENHFRQHECATSIMCKDRCQKQGNNLYHQYHQNFWYAIGTKFGMYNAPQFLIVGSSKAWDFIGQYNCDCHTQNFLRQMAQIGTYDLVEEVEGINDSKYDFAFVYNTGNTYPGMKRSIPSVMYGHDLWKRRKERQAALDQVRPEILYTPFYSSWKKHFRIPPGVEVMFRPVPASMFYTTTVLEPERKEHDLLVIGAAGSPIYKYRKELSKQLYSLADSYQILFHHQAGARRSKVAGKLVQGEMRYANAWSEFLGSARYVTFGRIAEEPQPVFFKYYECLGSGAIPIMPEAPDLKLVGVEAWKHYIPLSEIEGNNDAMRYLLDHYEEHYPIARNAVAWFQENADSLLFDGIDELVERLIGDKYPRRVR